MAHNGGVDTQDDGASAADRALELALDRYEHTLGDASLRAFLTARSGLPGAHADLDLANAFAENVAARAKSPSADDWWTLCRDFALMPASRAPTNDPAEFLCICGTLAASAMACIDGDHLSECLAILRRQALDPRWRLRDATVVGLLRLLLVWRTETLSSLHDWTGQGNPLHLRAAVKVLSEPAVLGSAEVVESAVRVHELAIDRLMRTKRPLSPAWRTLRLALGTSIGALVLVRPDAAVAMLATLSMAQDADAKRIVDQNLEGPHLRRLEPEALDRLRRIRSGV